MKEKFNYTLSIFFILTAVVLFSIACLYFSIHFFGAEENKTTYWFQSLQAVGSIAAIVGAFYIGGKQAEAALESVKQAHDFDLIGSRKKVLAVVNEVNNNIEEIVKCVNEKCSNDNPLGGGLELFYMYNEKPLKYIIDILTKTDFWVLDNQEKIKYFITYIVDANCVVNLLDEYIASKTNNSYAGANKSNELFGGKIKKQISDGKLKNIFYHHEKMKISFERICR